MADLTNPKWIYFKGILFLFSGALASILLIAEAPTLKIGLLLTWTIGHLVPTANHLSDLLNRWN